MAISCPGVPTRRPIFMARAAVSSCSCCCNALFMFVLGVGVIGKSAQSGLDGFERLLEQGLVLAFGERLVSPPDLDGNFRVEL